MATSTSRYGFSSTVSNSIPKLDRNTFNSTSTIISSRVRDIILDDSNKELFDNYGGWNSIGTIFIESTKNPLLSNQIPLIPAYPAFPNIKHYPLINELVPVIYLTDINSTTNTTSVSAYYLPPINVWNSVTHNGIPSSNVLPESQTKNYQQVEAGSPNIISGQSTEINLGQTFNENNVIDIHPLLPYEGDIIYEGRFGNSIRLGSTVNNAKILNTWSSVGDNGSPIFILRNGQGSYTTDSWEPVIENINNDKSSIYLTSTQQIPLTPISSIEASYTKSTRPQNINKYSEEQIILNSGRLVFNAKKDSIILGSAKSIHLTSNTSVNIDAAQQIAVVAPKVYLGSVDGEEGTQLQSLVLGENLNTLLGELSVFLGTLDIAFQTAIDATGAPIVSLQAIACDAQTLSKSITNIVNGKNLLSKQVKTI
jgi:hypothetical protein